MDASALVQKADAHYEEARRAAERTRAERDLVGQRTFDWDNDQRGRTVREEGRGQPSRDQACAALAEPQAAAGEGSEPPHARAAADEISSAERRPKASAAARESTWPQNHAPITSQRGLARRLAQRLQA